MKTLLFVSATMFACMSYAQTQNSLPTQGNVGVGTTTPTEKLQVSGSAKVDSTLYTDSTSMRAGSVESDFKVDGNLFLPNIPQISTLGEYDILFSGEGGKTFKGAYSLLADIAYRECLTDNGIVHSPTWANGDNKIYVSCPEVYVGIGTNTPNYSLDVHGFGQITGGLRFGTPTTISTPAYLEGNKPVTNQRPWIRLVNSNGGTPATAFLVENSGMLWCTGVKVRLDADIPVPDFVFNPNYELMPLTEVKSYVQQYSHLPNVPGEKELKTEGMSLEQMQLLLLQKVEELTLYMIDLNEKNLSLEEQNAELRRQIEFLKAQIAALQN